MDKQMIEEMAKAMGGCDYPHRHCEKCWYKERHECGAYACAKTLTKKGYRKIPEGAVWMTIPEKERLLKSVLEFDKTTMECLAKETRKETAEKFAEMAKEKAENEYLSDYRDWTDPPHIEKPDFQRIVDEICKELTGEKK